MKEGPVKGPISPRGRLRTSSKIQTPVLSQAEIPEPAAPRYEAPEFVLKLVASDSRYSKWVHENCLTNSAYFFLRFFEYSGDGLFWLPAAAVFWLSSLGSSETRLFALNLFISLLFDLFVVGSIKSAVRRKRPVYNRGHLVVVKMDRWSFPSGHSTRAVMIVTLIWLYTPLWRSMINQYWYSYLALRYEKNHFMTEYVLPCLENHLLTITNCVLSLWMLATICSRVILGRHYISDVVGGMVIGMLEALVAHFCLHVPLKVSEWQHAYILSKFQLYSVVLWRFFQGWGFFTNHHFEEMNRDMIDGAGQGPW